MNKKLLMSSLLGLAALSAGLLALTTPGGDDSSDRPGARSAHAEMANSSDEPAGISRENDPQAPVIEPATGPGTATAGDGSAPEAEDTSGAVPADEGDAAANEPDPSGSAPADDSNGGAPAPQPGAGHGPYLPHDPDIADIFCEVLCAKPQLPLDPDVVDIFCEALDCDGPAPTIDSPVKPCEVLGNCQPPIGVGDRENKRFLKIGGLLYR